MSRTRSPANGSAGDAGRRGTRGSRGVGGPWRQRSARPSRGAGSGAADVRRRAGTAVADSPRRPAGSATNVSRSRKCSNVVTFAPLAIGAFGIRKADARSSTSCDACASRSIRRWSAPAPCGRGRAWGPPSTRGARPWRRSRATAVRSRTRVRPARRWPPRRPVSARSGASAHRPAELVVEGHRIVGEGTLPTPRASRHRRARPEPRRRSRRQGADRARTRRQPTRRSGHRRRPAPGRAVLEPSPTIASGPGLQRELGRGLVAPGALEPERRDRRDDQVRMRAEDLPRRQARVLRQPQSRGDHTTASAEASSVVAATRGSPRRRPASTTTLCFDALRKLNERAVGVGRNHRAGGRPAAQRIALGRLDLDDLGAAVGQQLRAVGARRSRSRDRPHAARSAATPPARRSAYPSRSSVTVSRFRGAGGRSRSAASRAGTCCRCPSPRG